MKFQVELNQDSIIGIISYLSVMRHNRYNTLTEYREECGSDDDYADSLQRNIDELDAYIEELRAALHDATVNSFKLIMNKSERAAAAAAKFIADNYIDHH